MICSIFVLTDFTGSFVTKVLPRISDYKCTQMSITMHFPQPTTIPTDTWNFGAANWKFMFQRLSLSDWRIMDSMDVNDAVLWLKTCIFLLILSLFQKSLEATGCRVTLG